MPVATVAIAAPPCAMPYLLLGAAAAVCAAVGPGWGSPGLAVMAAVAAASLISSIAGFAFSAICGAILFHLLDDPVQIVRIMLTCSIANQALMVWAVRGSVKGRSLWVFLLGGAAGLPVGVWALLNADRVLYTHALGALLLGYGAYMLACKPRVLSWQHPGLDLAVGFCGGITGGAAAFPGAPVTIWCGLKGWDKAQQRAVFQPYILLMQIAALAAITVMTRQADHGGGFEPASLFCVPAGLLGTWIGLACFRTLSNRQFSLAVNIMLIVSGLSYVV